MKKRPVAALGLVLALFLGLTGPAAAQESPNREVLALQAASTAMAYGGATAVQYAVWEDGAIILSGQSGAYDKSGAALTAEHLFGIGSVSKVYTTAAVMKLAEEGKLSLDAPVISYLPGFKMADERYREITVRMLLNHSSGLMGGSTHDGFLFADADQTATKELLSRLSGQRLKADPGEIAVYCNDGFTLAELVVEAVSGQSFGTYLHEKILAPAGLKSTFVPQDAFDTARLVKTYATPDEKRPLPQDTLGIVGTGGLYATAADLAAFGGALTGSGILSGESLSSMAAAEYKRGIWPEDDADLIAYGLGWDSVRVYPFALSGVQALAKGGDTQFYHAALVVIPEYKLAAAVLTSGGASVYNELAAGQMLAAALADRGVTVEQTAPALPEAVPAPMPAELTAFSGHYGSFSQTMDIQIAGDGALTIRSLSIPSAPVQAFSYYSDGTFRDATGQAALIKFVTEKNGATYLYQKAWSDIPGLGLLPMSNYAAQKLEPGTADAQAQAAWDALSAMSALPVNMKYTSQLYATFFSAAQGELPTPVPGYVGALRIVDGRNLRNELRIPNQGGRDSQDMWTYEENGVTYLASTQGTLFADGSRVSQTLYTGVGAYATVGERGYARWYEVGQGSAGKTMHVTVPEDSGFYVYNADGTVAYSSVAYGDTKAVLPEDGAVVFAGAPGARFFLTFAP